MKKEIFYILFFIIMSAALIFNHELTHGQIFNYYGCSNITYGFNFPYGYTTADCTGRMTEWIDSAHNLNEVVGYNIMPMLALHAMLLFLILMKK